MEVVGKVDAGIDASMNHSFAVVTVPLETGGSMPCSSPHAAFLSLREERPSKLRPSAAAIMPLQNPSNPS